MANTITSTQIVLDTVVLKANAIQEKLFKGDIIDWMFTGAGAVAERAHIQSMSDAYIFEGRSNTTHYSTRIVLNRDWLDGFYVPVLYATSVIRITRGSGRVI